MNLRIPGPTPVPDSVTQAGAADMINHRGPEFADLINRSTAQLKEVFETKNDLFILTASGTGGMEAAVKPGALCSPAPPPAPPAAEGSLLDFSAPPAAAPAPAEGSLLDLAAPPTNPTV